MNARRPSFLLSVTLMLLGLAGCGSPLVGLECRDGFERCGGACYDLSSDEEHCGGCGITCRLTEQCVASACVPESVRPDGGTDDGGPGMDGGPGDGGPDIDANMRPDTGLDAMTDAQSDGSSPNDGSAGVRKCASPV